jgi:hypothetical protein
MYGEPMIAKIAILVTETIIVAMLAVWFTHRWRPEAAIALGAILMGAAAFLLPGVVR